MDIFDSGFAKPLFDGLRQLVSMDKNRLQKGEFNLDLTYITKNLIAMGYPAQTIEAAWRNSYSQVAKFFQTYHKGHFLIINLAEKGYDPSAFDGQVLHKGYPDHNSPKLEDLQHLIVTIDSFLSDHPENVVAIHCTAGRGRTGTIIAGYLLYSNQATTAEDALIKFAAERSSEVIGVTIPSQRRYVQYIEQILWTSPDGQNLRNGTTHIERSQNLANWQKRFGQKIYLKNILFKPIPEIDEDLSCLLVVKVYQQHGKLLLTTDPRRFYSIQATGSIDINLWLKEDIKIEFLHRKLILPSKSGYSPSAKDTTGELVDTSQYAYVDMGIFHFSFHCFEVLPTQQSLIFKRDQLDPPAKGGSTNVNCSSITLASYFQVELVLSSE
jgi:protein-tyrosine phosphatase